MTNPWTIWLHGPAGLTGGAFFSLPPRAANFRALSAGCLSIPASAIVIGLSSSFSQKRETAMKMQFWHLEFYRINSDGTHVGPEGATVNPPSLPIQSAIDRARSIMRNNTFTWGKANCFVIKNQDGHIVHEEGSYA